MTLIFELGLGSIKTSHHAKHMSQRSCSSQVILDMQTHVFERLSIYCESKMEIFAHVPIIVFCKVV